MSGRKAGQQLPGLGLSSLVWLVSLAMMFGTLGCQKPEPATLSGIAGAASQTSAELDANRIALQALDRSQQAELRGLKGRFDQLPPPTREQLRKLHQDLESHPQRAELLAVMDRYVAWTRSLDDRSLAQMLDKPVSERFEDVCSLRSRESISGLLPPSEMAIVENWIAGLARSKEVEISSALQELDAGEIVRLNAISPENRLRILLYTNEQAAASLIGEGELESLKGLLGRSSRNLLNSLDREQQVRAVVLFQPTDAELERFFADSLTEPQLAALPRKTEPERKRELRRIYLRNLARRSERE